ncbi:MAG: polysaccharide pyruvyl transferase family protein [bacterium]|nr:polysaccharide pyruvyl transferase family protein [bacterium]
MKLALFGNYGVNNLGDDLILKGFLNQHPDDEVMVFCGNPDRVHKQFGLEAHPFFPGGFRSIWKYLISSPYRRLFKRGLRELKSADRIFVGGGGILVDRHFKAVFLWWRQLRNISRSGTPFAFVANSFELKHWWSQWLFKTYLKSAEQVTVRDSASLRLAHSLGAQAKLVEDLAMENVGVKFRMKDPKKTIVLALCKWGLDKRKMAELRNFVRSRQEEGFEVIGLAFQTEGDDDREVFAELDTGIPVRSGMEEVLTELGNCNLIVGMRFHSVLLGLKMQKPVIAIAYQKKVRHLMEDAGKEMLCLEIQNLNGEKLQSVFEKAVEEGDG